MAANKFATMLHKNTHKITAILVYTLLEWLLILLLLLNSLFSFLITKFANYFGLKPPCLCCSNLNHILDPNKPKNSYKDLVCETHANEISKLNYCPNHQKFVESRNLCMNCSSTQSKCNQNPTQISRKFAFFTWVSEENFENGDHESTNCSCCDESLKSNVYPFNVMFKPSWEVLGTTRKANLITEAMDEYSDTCRTDSSAEHVKNEHDIEGKNEEEEDDDDHERVLVDEHRNLSDVESFNFGAAVDESMIQTCFGEDLSLVRMNLPPLGDSSREFYRIRTVELIDSSTVTKERLCICREEDQNGNFDSEPRVESQVELVEEGKIVKQVSFENFSVLVAEQMIEDLLAVTCEQLIVSQVDNNVEATDISEPCNPQGEEEDSFELLDDKTNSEDFISTEATLQVDQSFMEKTNVTTGFNAIIFGNDLGSKQIENGKNQEEVNHNLSTDLAVNEVDEDKLSDAANYMEGLHHLHKKLLKFEKRELGAEESWEGSVVSEVECGDGVVTVEGMKSALRAERKALSALYAELEAERSAAAIAANQTMAMITRLQEEKAAMQMEALQYQRMMEEQAEYDQEALQLLNELVVKRENEKQELEKELEMYRGKALDYEAKEKIVRRKDGSARSRASSASCSNAEDTDHELSIDLNRDRRDGDGNNNNASVDQVPNFGEMGIDCVKDLSTLDESLADFEDERLSILEELKALEDKLFALADEEGHVFEDVKPIEEFTDDYEKEFSENYDHINSPVENEVSNFFSGVLNGKHQQVNKIIGSNAKRLLPLFDATGIEIGEESNELYSSSDYNVEVESNRVSIEEEVDHIYERLQSLEANREFLKHCIGSLKKGDKGMDLLQEILQHLRDLRSIEIHGKNMV